MTCCRDSQRTRVLGAHLASSPTRRRAERDSTALRDGMRTTSALRAVLHRRSDRADQRVRAALRTASQPTIASSSPASRSPMDGSRKWPLARERRSSLCCPAFCFALHGLGAHVATVNAYLTQRDFEFARPAFERLGLTVGLLPEKQNRPQEAHRLRVRCDLRRRHGFRLRLSARSARRCAPRVAPSRAFTTSLLRRRPRQAAARPARSRLRGDRRSRQRAHRRGAQSADHLRRGAHARATTPQVYSLADAVATQLTAGEDFIARPADAAARADDRRRRAARWRCSPMTCCAVCSGSGRTTSRSALRARHRFRRDVHYVVQEGKVVIVDEFTGRLCPDRSWRGGLHQAVEACAGVAITE